jgi:hypothetical protein
MHHCTYSVSQKNKLTLASAEADECGRKRGEANALAMEAKEAKFELLLTVMEYFGQ